MSSAANFDARPQVRFRLLGPVEATHGGRPVPLTGKQRALLGCLLLEPNHVVSVERLIDRLWEENPPVSAAARVRALVAELRRALADDGARLIVTQSPGYRLDVGDGALDTVVFAERLAAGGQASLDGRYEDAVALFGRALELWRGAPLGGLSGPHVAAETARLTEQWAAALEGRAAALLELGRPHDAVAEAGRVIAEYPLRERPQGLLMLALHRSGRLAEALSVYRRFRSRLVAEIGVEPTEELVALHQYLLQGSADEERPTGPVPQQLPAGTSRFVGRAAELARLDELAGEQNHLVLVVGPAGAGKTALAVHWAHRAAVDYPDGQLFLSMRGFDHGRQLSAAEALPSLLLALGQPLKDIPVDVDTQAALYRSRLAGRRVLVLLDNVANPAQVRPLLPGTASCLVVVTSRDRLGGLVARDGAKRISLDALRAHEALDLLAHRVGVARLRAEPEAAAQLAAQCGHMPLALSIAGARLADQAVHTISGFVAELADRGRLARLRARGDEHTAVRAALDLSYRALPIGAQRMFRLLSLAPSGGLHVGAAAALAGVDEAEAEDLLDAIAQVHLTTEVGVYRFACHDLLLEYAADRAEREDSPQERQRAAQRLVQYYLNSVLTATRTVRLRGTELPYDGAEAGVVSASFDSEADAFAWLADSWDEITAVISRCAEDSPHPASWLLVAMLRDYMHHRRPLAEWIRVASIGLAAARRGSDLIGQAAMHLSLGHARWRMAELAPAKQDYEQALTLSGRAGWPKGEADALRGLGVTLKQLGQPRQALLRYHASVEIDRRLGDSFGEVSGLNNLSSAYHLLGELEHAEQCLSACLRLAEQNGHDYQVALTLVNLALVRQEQGRLDDASHCLDRSLVIARTAGLRYAEAITLETAGRVHNDAGRWVDAATVCADALVAARSAENRNCQVDALVGMAEAKTGLGRLDEALADLNAAAALNELTGHQLGRVETLLGLTQVYSGLDQNERAHEYAVSALRLARDTSPLARSKAHRTLAEVLLGLGDGAGAVSECGRAIAIARRSGQRLVHARVLVVLGRAHRLAGNERAARSTVSRAHRVFVELAIPRQTETAALLRQSSHA
ncbi:BTAD domain-containing putative transcriptional regulator [Amycolatopsis sp. NPDC005003]